MELIKLTKKQIKIRIILLICLVVFVILGFYANHNLGATFYVYSSSKVSSETDGLRIVQISDYHNSNLGPSSTSVADQTRLLKPDIIIITGDFIDSRNTDIDDAIECAELLVDICPVLYTNGNHELRLSSSEQSELYSRLEDCGVVVLLNESFYFFGINFIGLNDDSLDNNVLSQFIDRDSLNIVLAHEPQFLENYGNNGADLVFSGHAHGGQFRIPFTDIGFVAPDQGLFPKLISGEHISGDTTMIVSRGIGNSIIPVRIFDDPEIVVVDLKSE